MTTRKDDNITILPDGSAFFVASLPLPADHWLYAPGCTEWDSVRDTSADVPHPILTHAQRETVIAAVRYAIRGATMCGKESDFDPDALVQNAVFALCGPYGFDAPATEAHADVAPQEPSAWMLEVPSESKRWYTSGKQAMEHWVSKGAVATPLYAAPVPSQAATQSKQSDERGGIPARDDGRENVEDVLAIVRGYGPYGRDINEALRFQIVLADEILCLRALYLSAVKGRQDFRRALREAREAAPQAGALPPAIHAFLTECAGFHGQMVKGNWLSAEAAKLLAPPTTASADAEDAARYRWLRKEHFPTADNPPLAQVVWKAFDDRHSSQWANVIDGRALDAAIDTARKGASK